MTPRTNSVLPDVDMLDLLAELNREIARQDRKHGPFEGTHLGRSRLALACLEDEIEEAKQAWREERKQAHWLAAHEEVLQVAAVAMRALRDAFDVDEAAQARARDRSLDRWASSHGEQRL